jgi:peptide/nickel transport system permease protein
VLTAVLKQPTHSWWHGRTAVRFRSHKLSILGSCVLGLMLIACFLGPALLGLDPLAVDLLSRFAPPLTKGHVLGADPLGRDVFARLLVAGQTSLLVGLAAMVLSSLIGSSVGIAAGYLGGRIGNFLMRIVDAFLSIPAIFLLLTLAAFVKPSPGMIVVIISAVSWMEVARIVEPEVKSLREREFVAAARMMGLGRLRIMLTEILPNAVGPIVVASTLIVARSILAEAYISFLGYGIQPPLPSWGNMLNGAQQYLTDAPWLAIVPGIAITLAVVSVTFIGDGLRDAFDPRTDPH